MVTPNFDSENSNDSKSEIQYSYRVQGSFILIFLLSFALFLTQNSVFIPYLIPTLILLYFVHSNMTKPAFSMENIQIQRKLSRDRIVEGKELEVILKIRNKSNQKSNIIELLDTVPEKFNLLSGLNQFLFFLNPNETLVMSYKVKCDYVGIFNFNSVSVILKDYLGVTNQSHTFSELEMKGLEKEIIVIPKLEKLETLPVAANWLKFYNGNFKSKTAGLDLDFRSVRKFLYGDSLRSINWKKTAQYQGQNDLYSNTFNEDKAIDAEIVYDTTFSAGSIWVEGLRQVMSLSDFLLRNRNKVGLTIMNQYPDYVKPKFGKRHLKFMIDLLMQVDTEELKDEKVINMRLKNIMKKYNDSSVVIIISPFLNNFVFEFATNLKHNNFKVLAITPLAIQAQLDNVKYDEVFKSMIEGHPAVQKFTETTLLMMQKTIETRLKKEKIFQIRWNISQPLETAFRYVRVAY